MRLCLVLSLAISAIPEERFDSMANKGVEARLQLITDQVLQAAERKRDRIAYKTVAAPIPSLTQMQTATAIAAASAAISTSLEGVEAGVSVSPFLVAGKFDWVVQPNLTLAALEEGGARFGLGFATRFGEEPIGPSDLGLKPCVPTIDKLKAAIEKFRLPYLTVCTAAARPVVAASISEDLRAEVKQACGIEGDELPLIQALSVLSVAGAELATLGSPVFEGREDLELRQKVGEAAAALERLNLPTIDDCWTDDEVADAAASAAANARTINVGLSGNVDLLPIQWGFAGDSTLSKGEYAAWEVRAEARWARRGYELGGAVGFNRSRAELGKPLFNALAVEFRAAMILASLSSAPLRKEGALATDDGELPPHLIIGILVNTTAALTRPETQITPLNKFEVTPYVEAHFGEKLAVRLGIPVRATVVTRAAVAATEDQPASPELRDLQWSIPPTITTVLKID